MRLASLLTIVLISLSGCNSLDKEPVIEFCVIIDGQIAECNTPADPKKPQRDLTTIDMIGYVCVSASHYADADSHHTILHREIDQKDKK